MEITKQKLLFITGIYPIFKGGAEFQMRLIADQLKDEFEIIFVYLGDIPGENVKYTYDRVIDGYKVYFVKSCGKWDSLFFKYAFSRRLYNILKIEKPDIVYQRVLKFVSYYISKYQKELGYKHFIHIADLFTIKFNNETFRNRFNFYFFKKTLQYNPKFIVQTDEQSQILSNYGVKPILQVYNMHPLPNFDVSEVIQKKLKENPKHIIWVANIKKLKRLELFLDLAEHFKNDSSIHFDVIGNIQNNQYAQPLTNRIAKLSNLSHHIDKDNTFVNQFILEQGFLTVNTSESEGFSNVFIQSWLRGVPIVSLNSNPDTLFNKFPEFGVFCDNSTEKLCVGIKSILESKSYEDRAIKCYETSSRLFSFDNINKVRQLLTK